MKFNSITEMSQNDVKQVCGGGVVDSIIIPLMLSFIAKSICNAYAYHEFLKYKQAEKTLEKSNNNAKSN